MTISVVSGSVSINIPIRPQINSPFPNSQLGAMIFNCSGITIQGQCKLDGASSDLPAGWTLGFIQLKWIDTEWAYYRGQSNTEGSTFWQMARPPALSARSCRDTIAVGAVFVDNNAQTNTTVAAAGTNFPIPMSAMFTDAPQRYFPFTCINPKTNKINILHEAQIELHFCTVLSLRSPTGVYKHLKSVYWDVHWQAVFEPSQFGNLSGPWKITKPANAIADSANVSRIFDGPPIDSRFSSILTAPQAVTCNSLTIAAFKHPNIRASNVWTNFDVTI